MKLVKNLYTDDAVAHPSHYTNNYGNIEVKDAMKAFVSTQDEYLAYLKLNAIKYLGREGKKDDREQDLRKAIQYIEFMIDELDN